MLNGMGINAALSDLESYFQSAGPDNIGDARSALTKLDEEIPAANRVRHPDKGSTQVFRDANARRALGLIEAIWQCIEFTDGGHGLELCR